MAATGNTFFFPWEVNLMEWLQGHIGGAGISIISLFSIFGEELLMILLLGFIYWSYDKKLGRTIGLSAIMGLTWNTMIKNLVLRRRPYFDHENIKILRVVEPEADIYDIAAQGYSFPSVHSTNSATMFGALAVNLRKRWMTVLAIVIPLLTGVSRVILGAHYPTDVLAGWLLGVASVLLVSELQSRVKNTLALYGILFVAAVPGFFFCKSADYFTAMGLLIGFMGATLLDDHCVRFENTRKPVWMIARTVGGLAVYVALNAALKLIVAKVLPFADGIAAMLARCARYAVVTFVAFGVYPMAFRLEKRKLN